MACLGNHLSNPNSPWSTYSPDPQNPTSEWAMAVWTPSPVILHAARNLYRAIRSHRVIYASINRTSGANWYYFGGRDENALLGGINCLPTALRAAAIYLPNCNCNNAKMYFGHANAIWKFNFSGLLMANKHSSINKYFCSAAVLIFSPYLARVLCMRRRCQSSNYEFIASREHKATLANKARIHSTSDKGKGSTNNQWRARAGKDLP